MKKIIYLGICLILLSSVLAAEPISIAGWLNPLDYIIKSTGINSNLLPQNWGTILPSKIMGMLQGKIPQDKLPIIEKMVKFNYLTKKVYPKQGVEVSNEGGKKPGLRMQSIEYGKEHLDKETGAKVRDKKVKTEIFVPEGFDAIPGSKADEEALVFVNTDKNKKNQPINIKLEDGKEVKISLPQCKEKDKSKCTKFRYYINPKTKEKYFSIQGGVGDIQFGDKMFSQIKDAEFRVNEQGGITLAEFTSEKGGSYAFDYKKTKIKINVQAGGRVKFDPESKKTGNLNGISVTKGDFWINDYFVHCTGASMDSPSYIGCSYNMKTNSFFIDGKEGNYFCYRGCSDKNPNNDIKIIAVGDDIRICINLKDSDALMKSSCAKAYSERTQTSVFLIGKDEYHAYGRMDYQVTTTYVKNLDHNTMSHLIVTGTDKGHFLVLQKGKIESTHCMRKLFSEYGKKSTRFERESFMTDYKCSNEFMFNDGFSTYILDSDGGCMDAKSGDAKSGFTCVDLKKEEIGRTGIKSTRKEVQIDLLGYLIDNIQIHYLFKTDGGTGYYFLQYLNCLFGEVSLPGTCLKKETKQREISNVLNLIRIQMVAGKSFEDALKYYKPAIDDIYNKGRTSNQDNLAQSLQLDAAINMIRSINTKGYIPKSDALSLFETWENKNSVFKAKKLSWSYLGKNMIPDFYFYLVTKVNFNYYVNKNIMRPGPIGSLLYSPQSATLTAFSISKCGHYFYDGGINIIDTIAGYTKMGRQFSLPECISEFNNDFINNWVDNVKVYCNKEKDLSYCNVPIRDMYGGAHYTIDTATLFTKENAEFWKKQGLDIKQFSTKSEYSTLSGEAIRNALILKSPLWKETKVNTVDLYKKSKDYSLLSELTEFAVSQAKLSGIVAAPKLALKLGAGLSKLGLKGLNWIGKGLGIDKIIRGEAALVKAKAIARVTNKLEKAGMIVCASPCKYNPHVMEVLEKVGVKNSEVYLDRFGFENAKKFEGELGAIDRLMKNGDYDTALNYIKGLKNKYGATKDAQVRNHFILQVLDDIKGSAEVSGRAGVIAEETGKIGQYLLKSGDEFYLNVKETQGVGKGYKMVVYSRKTGKGVSEINIRKYSRLLPDGKSIMTDAIFKLSKSNNDIIYWLTNDEIIIYISKTNKYYPVIFKSPEINAVNLEKLGYRIYFSDKNTLNVMNKATNELNRLPIKQPPQKIYVEE